MLIETVTTSPACVAAVRAMADVGRADTPPAHARTSATERGWRDAGAAYEVSWTMSARSAVEKELTRGQPFDDAHGRPTARARPRRSWRGGDERFGAAAVGATASA